MLIVVGAQVSAAGGVSRAVERAAAMDAGAIQVFVDQNRRYPRGPLPVAELRTLRVEASRRAIPGYLHVPYLANPATPDAPLRARTIDMVARSLRAAALAGFAGVVVHPGSHLGRGFAAVHEQVVRTLAQAWREGEGAVPLLLENTAGGGGQLGARVDELAWLLAALGAHAVDAGVCIDFAHAHAAGWDLAKARGVDRFARELREQGVAERVRLVHANDSRAASGSHRDLHANPGAGTIRAHGLRLLAAVPELARVPWILEVPGDGRGGPRAQDVRRLREIVSPRASARPGDAYMRKMP